MLFVKICLINIHLKSTKIITNKIHYVHYLQGVTQTLTGSDFEPHPTDRFNNTPVTCYSIQLGPAIESMVIQLKSTINKI